MEVHLSAEISSSNELKVTPNEKQTVTLARYGYSIWIVTSFKVKKNLVAVVSPLRSNTICVEIQ